MSVLTAGSLTFAPKVAVDITNDAIVEDVERFMVSLVFPAQIMTCGGQNGENTTVNATVLDDDCECVRVCVCVCVCVCACIHACIVV